MHLIKMELIDNDSILNDIHLFATLSEPERQLVKQKMVLREYKKGEIIYEEGAPVDAFYCVVLGRIVIYTEDAQGNDTIVEYLHRGKYFGIISLLTGDCHSVTAKSINDSLVLVISKQDFDIILNKIPRLAIDLSQTLSRRLKRKDIHQKTIFESTIISIFSSYVRAGKTIYAMNLAGSLKNETHKSVVIVEITTPDKNHTMPVHLEIGDNYPTVNLSKPQDYSEIIEKSVLKTNFGLGLICLYYNPQDDSCVKKLIGILTFLVNDFHYIILDLPSLMDRVVFGILNQSDLIHILTNPQPLNFKRSRNLIARLKKEFGFSEKKISVIINEYSLSRISHRQQLELLDRSIFATLPKTELAAAHRIVLENPDSEYAKAVRRIARQVGDCMVGLALGVGLGYGLCHIGVLKVIEEEKIPIDVICGSSFGALIASLWVTGKSTQDILEITREFKQPKYIWSLIDLTFPFFGFIKGNKLHNFLKKHLGNKTFYDVKLPLKIVASDVKRKEPRIIDKGLLVDAIMTSCTMPGVFRPYKPKEGILFDGGVIFPLPTEPLFKMGVAKIIAVNVTPSREDIIKQYENVKDEIALDLPDKIKKNRWLGLKMYLKNKFKTNILQIIFSSIEVMQSEMARKESELADLVLHPDTCGMHWLELHRAEDFAKRGEAETRKNLSKIWQVINQ